MLLHPEVFVGGNQGQMDKTMMLRKHLDDAGTCSFSIQNSCCFMLTMCQNQPVLTTSMRKGSSLSSKRLP